MAFDQTTRNRLQRFVSDARDLLTAEFIRQAQNEYGLDPATGKVASLETLTHLDDTHRETAAILRDTLAHYLATSPSSTTKEVLERIVREQAFTILYAAKKGFQDICCWGRLFKGNTRRC